MTLQDFEFAILTGIGICILICLVKKNKNDSEMLQLTVEHLTRVRLNMEFWEKIAVHDREKHD